MGVSTEVTLPSGSSEEIRVGSNPVTCTNKMSTALVVVLVLFIRMVGFEIGRKLRQQFVRRTEQLITVRRLRPPRAEIPFATRRTTRRVTQYSSNKTSAIRFIIQHSAMAISRLLNPRWRIGFASRGFNASALFYIAIATGLLKVRFGVFFHSKIPLRVISKKRISLHFPKDILFHLNLSASFCRFVYYKLN